MASEIQGLVINYTRAFRNFCDWFVLGHLFVTGEERGRGDGLKEILWRGGGNEIRFF